MGEKRIIVKGAELFVGLDFPRFHLEAAEVHSRLEQILPILEEILCADEVWWGLADDETLARVKGKLAQDMVFEMSLYQAKLAASAVLKIVSSDDTSAPLGFPEFGHSVDPLEDD